MPIPAPSIPRQPPPAPRVEKKPESKNVDDILKPPGRESRPERVSDHSEAIECVGNMW